jgi:hypothetical protein
MVDYGDGTGKTCTKYDAYSMVTRCCSITDSSSTIIDSTCYSRATEVCCGDGRGKKCPYTDTYHHYEHPQLYCCIGSESTTCYDYQTEQCCPGSRTGKTCPNTKECCISADGSTANCCDPAACEDCNSITGECQSRCPDCQTCDGAGNCRDCDPNKCETCIDGKCKVCGGDPNKQCCGSGQCCNNSCTNNWLCQKCGGLPGYCAPCLQKPDSYNELYGCNRIDDPATSPVPNGCSVPWYIVCLYIICGMDRDNPAGCENTSFHVPCDEHDECYQGCYTGSGSNKDGCDTTFSNRLTAKCAEVPPGECYDKCIIWKSRYVWAVENYGEDAYEDDQVDACACNNGC